MNLFSDFEQKLQDAYYNVDTKVMAYLMVELLFQLKKRIRDINRI